MKLKTQHQPGLNMSPLDPLRTPNPTDSSDYPPTSYGDDFVNLATEAVETGNQAVVRQLAHTLHEADVADLLEQLPAADQIRFVALAGDQFDFAVLTEIDTVIRQHILSSLPIEVAARGLGAIDADDTVFILDDVPASERNKLLSHLPSLHQSLLKRSLELPPDTAGRIMQPNFVAIPAGWTVGQSIDYLRGSERIPPEFFELYLIDPAYRPLGTVGLSHLLRRNRLTRMQDIMEESLHRVRAEDDQEEVALMFQRYNLVSAPVIDADERLVGTLTIDDIVDVMQREAEEDIHGLGGVGHEELSDPIGKTARNRFTWLLVNLGSAIAASGIIYLFDGPIEKMVALAILMPIIASMGGNAGTQTMTVVVRAMATRDLVGTRATRTVVREVAVALINGVALGIISALVAAIWFQDIALGVVVAIAMVINLTAAGLTGILVPLGIRHFGIDPALASGVLVTTVTDIVGFFVFLAIASHWFNLS